MQPGARLGPYEIVAPLGAGGMGEVWRARDTKLARDVALKVLPDHLSDDPKALARFENEAKAVAALSHPHLLAIYDFGRIDGISFAVTELVEGETLRAVLARGALPLKKTLEIAAQVADALAAAHDKGIVHRDVKPENVMLTRDGRARLLDFGIARKSEPPYGGGGTRSSTISVLTEPGAVVGTVAYMSPEQARGLPVDTRTDQFSLGIVLYEMLSGRRPFQGASAPETLAAIIGKDPVPLETLVPTLPIPVRVVVDRLLAKDPTDRYASSRDLARDLAIWTLRSSETSASASAAPGTRPSLRHRATFVASGIALAAAILACGFWFGHATGRPARPRPAPIPQLVRLTWEPGIETNPSISPDGASFVYQAGPSGHSHLLLRRIGGETPTDLTKDNPADNSAPAFSPDGRSIAFRSEREGGGIFVMGATGESPRRLTDFGYEPAWSPDGKTIAVATRKSLAGGGGNSALWIVDVATGAKRKLSDSNATHPTWSPSGSRIAFHQRAEFGSLSGHHALSTIPASGGVPTTVLDLPTSLPSIPAWTRGWLWFLSSAGGYWNIWRVRVDETTGKRIGEAEQALNGIGSTWPSATADGRKLLFAMVNKTTVIDRFAFDAARGRLLPEKHPILSGPRDFRLKAASPDGEWLATTLFDEGGRQDILLVRVRTGETRRLTDDPLREDFQEWAPDGSKLYFGVAPEGKNEVWSLRPDGSGREREVGSDGKRDVIGPLASPDGRSLLVEVGADLEPHLVDVSVPLAQRTPVPLPPLAAGRQFSAEAWSPDGRWLAGYSYSPADGRRPPLTLFDTEKRTFEELVDLKSTPWCAWLPDSRRLLLRRGEKLEVLDRVTRTLTPAGSLGADVQRVVLSPDGRSLFGMRWVVEADIWMLDYGPAP